MALHVGHHLVPLADRHTGRTFCDALHALIQCECAANCACTHIAFDSDFHCCGAASCIICSAVGYEGVAGSSCLAHGLHSMTFMPASSKASCISSESVSKLPGSSASTWIVTRNVACIRTRCWLAVQGCAGGNRRIRCVRCGGQHEETTTVWRCSRRGLCAPCGAHGRSGKGVGT